MALATKPKPTHHHKKATGQHHKKSKHYLKSYWPYIPMLFVVGVGIAINVLLTPTQGVLGDTSSLTPAALTAATNDQRTAVHEDTLKLNPELTAAAQAKAEDMAARNYWSHQTPDGKEPWSFIAASGYQYQLAGENLAFGFAGADDTVTGWMNSAEHRANILNGDYTEVGFGVATSPDYQHKGPETIVVAFYAEPITPVTTIRFTVPEPSAVATSAQSGQVLGAQSEPASQPVSRIQLLTGGHAAWSLLVVTFISGAALVIFLIRHGIKLHRLLVRGEVFVMHHPVLDFVIVVVMTTGFILSRTSGLIR